MNENTSSIEHIICTGIPLLALFVGLGALIFSPEEKSKGSRQYKRDMIISCILMIIMVSLLLFSVFYMGSLMSSDPIQPNRAELIDPKIRVV